MPKLRKTSIGQPKEEPKPETAKTKAKAKPKPKSKYEELPEIPDYERPVLEKFEKPEFEASDFTRQTEIPNKMEKPVFDTVKPQPQQAEEKNGLPKVITCSSNNISKSYNYMLRILKCFYVCVLVCFMLTERSR